MVARMALGAVAGLLCAFPAGASDLKPEQARKFVAGKLFSFSCFEGTRGAGRINPDGSVAGNIQMQGNGPARFVALPANTLRVSGEKVCASVKGVPFEPCFNLTQTDERSFRGAISGFGFAYCDFTSRGRARSEITRSASRNTRPLALRSTITE
jgi:hypothetical protein